MNTDIVTEKVVGEKKVYIVENHHEVLIPWSEYASKNDTAPVLLTFDHHIDTRSAFYRHACRAAGQEWRSAREQLIEDTDINESSEVAAALERLCNDEHIDFALQTGIISDAAVFSLMGAGICRDYANSRICYVDPVCTSNGSTSYCDDKALINSYDRVIEGEELLYKLNQINKFIPGFFTSDRIDRKFILDIDLDSFHTRKSIDPVDKSLFYYLINNAEIITIAREGNYVELEKIDDDIDVEYLLDKLLEHIENAGNIKDTSHSIKPAKPMQPPSGQALPQQTSPRA